MLNKNAMKKFILHWIDGRTELIEGTDIADACRNAGIEAGTLRTLDFYEEDDNKMTRVAGTANCECAPYSVKDVMSCLHDLKKAGL